MWDESPPTKLKLIQNYRSFNNRDPSPNDDHVLGQLTLELLCLD